MWHGLVRLIQAWIDCGWYRVAALLSLLTLAALIGCRQDAPPGSPTPNLRLIRIGDQSASRRGDIIFIHGLGGNERGTWEGQDGSFWLDWISKDFPQFGVWSVGYDANASEWMGGSMPFQDRAKSIMERLRLEHIGTDKPVIFVTHSLGGIVTKQMLRISADANDDLLKSLAKRTRGVVFLATPHTGSNLATYLENLAQALDIDYIGRKTDLAHQLRGNAPELRELNDWYRGNSRRLRIATRTLYEMRSVVGGRKVVDEGPSDPGIEGSSTVPVDEDHFSISKPSSTDAVVYLSVREFIRLNLLPEEEWNISLEEFVQVFNEARRRESVQAFNHDHGGKRVLWHGVVRMVHLPKSDPDWLPGYSIAPSMTTPSTDWVLVPLDRDSFRDSIKAGDSIRIEGRISPENSASGARLFDSNWGDE